MQNATYQILVLDDDASLRGAIIHWARRQGYGIHPAATASEARDIVNRHPIDLALLDIRLPDEDGVALAESLIADDPERPVLLMTAYADLDSAKKAIRIGVFEFFTKPMSFDVMDAAVSRALQHRTRLIENRLERTAELAAMNQDLKREVAQRREGEQILTQQTRTLSEANERLQQKDRLLTAYQSIARIALSTLNPDEIVDRVCKQLVEARIFKGLVIGLVDSDSGRLKVVRSTLHSDGAAESDLITHLLGDKTAFSLEDPNIPAAVVNSGEMVIVGAEDLPDSAELPVGLRDRDLAFFVPIKTETRVIGFLGIGGLRTARAEMLRHIEAMDPMLDQIAFALDHALLYRSSQDYARMIADVNAELEREIMDRRRAEEAVVRLERLGALGEMSAGISHNLNNILTGILGPAELISYMTEQEDVLVEANLIRTSALRARDLVMRLHQSVRGEHEKVGAVRLDDVVRKAIAAGRPKWEAAPRSAAGEIRLDSALTSGAIVAAHAPGLHDLVQNLLFNASDALTDGGTITVATELRDGLALLRVSDDGVGMDAEVKRRVFEPFFTTKADVGTGLGLSTVYGQVTRWGGTIDVTSLPGSGTTFEVKLPVWNGSPVIADREPVVVRSGRILVVEDEEMVREVVTRVVGLKHDVTAVEDGPSARAALLEDTYDVLLIDLGIPGIAGDQISRQAKLDYPGLATVLMTGWSLSDDDPRTAPFDLRIQKPFESIADLIDIVDRAIRLRDERTG